MATLDYMNGRRKYQRPQALLFADNPGTIIDGFYVPLGLEVNQEITEGAQPQDLNQFVILSDDNRDEISFNINRIENRKRMINGRMRSYHIADKLEISASWSMLPSRSYSSLPNFSEDGKSEYYGKNRYQNSDAQEFTSDGGAGGVELLDWYEKHNDSFWVYLAYDKYTNFGKDSGAYTNLQKYNEVVEVFFSDFSYGVAKRGGSNHDFWNISLKLEEV
jgi:hypothetical protein